MAKQEAEKLTKEEKIEKERAQVFKNALSGNLLKLIDKVAYILNNHPESRNSDIDLAWNYWLNFENNIFKGHISSISQLYSLTKISSLIRARAKIQNEYKLFEAEDIVKRRRHKLELEKKEAAILEKPKNLPSYNVYIDESGKNDKYLIVGSIWVTDTISDPYKTNLAIDSWKKSKGIKYEFHFTEMKKGELGNYKEYFTKFLSLNPTISFKAIIINNSGFSNKSDAIESLTFYLIKEGVINENSTKRAPLPRNLSAVVDSDQLGSDKLKAQHIKERIMAQNIEGLYCQNIEPLDSKDNNYLQIADLFAASINRKLNFTTNDAKDQLADFILSHSGLNLDELDKENKDIDKVKLFDLTFSRVNN